MNSPVDKKTFAKKTTIRLYQEDLDFLEQISAEYDITQQSAIRMLLYLSRCNIEMLKNSANIIIIH